MEICPSLLQDAQQAMSVLHTLPMYTIPEPGDADAYLDDVDMGQVVPISKLLSLEPPAKESNNNNNNNSSNNNKQATSRRFNDRIRSGMPNFVSRNRYSPAACGKLNTS